MTSPVEQGSGLSTAQLAALLALVQAQARVRQQLTRTAAAGALVALRGFTGWWDAGQITAMITRILRVVRPAQLQAARTTDAYIARATQIITGRTVRPAGAVDLRRLRFDIPTQVADELVAGLRRPAWVELGDTVSGPGPRINEELRPAIAESEREYQPPEEPYGRIADQVRYQLVAEGRTQEQAAGNAAVRLQIAAQTDVTLAVRAQYRKSLGQHKADGYRRILHPELSETGPCGLCVVAADRVYKSADLLPLHSRCVCEVLPVYGRLDPGFVLNGDDLRALYAAAGGTGAAKLLRVRVALAEHGELGAVLVDADRHYRSPVDVAKTKATNRRPFYEAQLAELTGRLGILEYRAGRGENVTRSLEWNRNRVAELRRLVGAR